MGTSSRSRRRLAPAERRRELLEAAIAVLRERGAEECRVEDITDAAGTAKGNFYRYFDSFDDLLVAVRDHLFDEYRQALLERHAARSDPDWWAVLDDEITGFFSFRAEQGALHDVLFHGPAARDRPLGDRRSASALIALLLEAGASAGAWVADDPEALGEVLFHAIHGATDAVAVGADSERMRAITLQVCRGALTARKDLSG